MGDFQSLVPFVRDPLVNFTIMWLIVMGGLGFALILELIRKPKTKQRISVHGRTVLIATAMLVFGGGILFWLFERHNPDTLGELPLSTQLMASLFQSVTCRTAGFNTIDQTALCEGSKLLSFLLMFIGGAPAGTAGGVKITTVAMLFFSVRSLMRGREETELLAGGFPATP